ncbi:MAG: hypothetical protein O2944_04770 [Proteobacteria bacterium]|nr:hypothetical protein [Pseudomonadota bacterium]
MPISIQTAVLGGAVAPALFGTSATAIAQQTGGAGYTRIQGATPSADAPTTDKFADKLQDLREDMRVFVQGVATYAHSQRRGFLVLARDSMELVIKRDVQDEKKISPAKTFMRSIDGVMENGVFFGKTAVNLATSKEIQPFLLERLAMTKNYGLPIMIMDYDPGHHRQRLPRCVEAWFRRHGIAPPGRSTDRTAALSKTPLQ